MTALHIAVVCGFLVANLSFPAINKLPRVVYSLLAFTLFVEWKVSLAIIRAFERRKAGSQVRD